MNSDYNLLSIQTASTDASKPAPVTAGPVVAGKDSSSDIFDLDAMFGSIYDQQLEEKNAPGSRASISLVTAISAGTDDLITAGIPQNVVATENTDKDGNSKSRIGGLTLVQPDLLSPIRAGGAHGNADQLAPAGSHAIANSPKSTAESASGLQHDSSTADPSSRLGLIKTESLNDDATAHLLHSHPLAGSLATPSDDLTPRSRQTLAVDVVSTSASPQNQWSGKLIPPSGNNPPGNLPFNSNPGDAASQPNAISDLTHESAHQGQQLLRASDSQSALQHALQGPAPLPALNLGNVESPGGGRVAGTFTVEGSTSFLIDSSAGSQDWENQLGNRIRWMGKINIPSAELKLHPAELGALEIKISTEDDLTKVNFITNNLAAKEIIEASLPRLRDLLASSGLQLEHSDVSQKNLADDKAGQEKTTTKATTGKELNAAKEDGSIRVRQRSLNQIDHYV
ncbi:MAG: flagellar hook-length control protein FliK [Proteobacteria bacterium]|nr:flagellar hook-length control protein FliK [Pseudomonadota bacterium]